MQNTHLIRVGAVLTAAALAANLAVLAVSLIVFPDSFIGIAVQGAALVTLVLALSEFWTSLRCLRWRQTGGRVVVISCHRLSRLHRSLAVGVAYEVGGRRYSQTSVEYAGDSAQSGAGRYRVGAEVPVYYDPRAPQRSRLRLPTTHAGFAYLAVGVLALLLAVAGMWA